MTDTSRFIFQYGVMRETCRQNAGTLQRLVNDLQTIDLSIQDEGTQQERFAYVLDQLKQAQKNLDTADARAQRLYNQTHPVDPPSS